MFKPFFFSLLLLFACFAPNSYAASYTSQIAVYQPIEPQKTANQVAKIRKNKRQKQQQKAADPYVIFSAIAGAGTLTLGILFRLWPFTVMGAILLAVGIAGLFYLYL